MEVKKSKKAEIESNRITWLLIGFISVLACMFVAFEWNQRDMKISSIQGPEDPIFVEELIPITFNEEKPLPPPPPTVTPAEILQIVDNEADVVETSVQGTEENHEAVAIKEVAKPMEEEVGDMDADFFIIVEEMPSFPGGQKALMEFMGKNIKYPTVSQETGVQGKVIVQFVVDKDGSIINPIVVRSIDPYLDKEALRVIKSMPKWKPGMQRGKAVRVKYTVPVTFKLQ